jgi:hypothetical protein
MKTTRLKRLAALASGAAVVAAGSGCTPAPSVNAPAGEGGPTPPHVNATASPPETAKPPPAPPEEPHAAQSDGGFRRIPPVNAPPRLPLDP